jgi:hypothetical protein
MRPDRQAFLPKLVHAPGYYETPGVQRYAEQRMKGVPIDQAVVEPSAADIEQPRRRRLGARGRPQRLRDLLRREARLASCRA